MIWGATAINLRGSVRVGRASIIAGAFVMLGFLAMSITATPHLTHIPWQPFASEKGKGIGAFAVGISIELWNYIGLGQRLDRARRSERCRSSWRRARDRTRSDSVSFRAATCWVGFKLSR